MTDQQHADGKETDGLGLDDIVALAAIVAEVVGRPMSPNESSRLRAAWIRGRSLTGIADHLTSN